jgi:hypothetical protein
MNEDIQKVWNDFLAGKKVFLGYKTLSELTAYFTEQKGEESDLYLFHREIKSNPGSIDPDLRVVSWLKANDKNPSPLPGDCVFVIESDDPNVPVDSVGIIKGMAGKAKEVYTVCFNPSSIPWWIKPSAFTEEKIETIQSTGGQEYIIPVTDLIYTCRIRRQPFQNWRNGIPLAGHEATTYKLVNVWENILKRNEQEK